MKIQMKFDRSPDDFPINDVWELEHLDHGVFENDCGAIIVTSDCGYMVFESAMIVGAGNDLYTLDPDLFPIRPGTSNTVVEISGDDV